LILSCRCRLVAPEARREQLGMSQRLRHLQQGPGGIMATVLHQVASRIESSRQLPDFSHP